MELKKYENIITSQWGEDGIIDEIFNRIGEANKTCVEFGAWNGKHLSNCWNLWHNKGWKSILIEGEEDRVADLKKDLTNFPNVTPVLRFVEIEGKNSLDSILDEISQTERIDLISIDIDSDDYAIFESLKRKPRVVIIEYNPTIPPHIDLIQRQGWNLGNSVSSTYKLAVKKGYKLAYLTYTNLILVAEDQWEALNISEVDYIKAFQYDKLTCVINTYQGDTLLSQPMPYNAGYMENRKIGVKKFVKQRFSSENDVSFPEFDSSGNIIHCKVFKK
jgi:hypothetical protein